MTDLLSFDDLPTMNVNHKSYYEMESELHRMNDRIRLLEQSIDKINIRLRDHEKYSEKNEKRIIDIYKYYKSIEQLGGIASVNDSLIMIFKRFFDYTFNKSDFISGTVIRHDYEQLPERVALRERERIAFGMHCL